jgi:hypothetical protein
MSWRRATSDARTPRSKLSATIRPLSATLPPTPPLCHLHPATGRGSFDISHVINPKSSDAAADQNPVRRPPLGAGKRPLTAKRTREVLHEVAAWHRARRQAQLASAAGKHRLYLRIAGEAPSETLHPGFDLSARVGVLPAVQLGVLSLQRVQLSTKRSARSCGSRRTWPSCATALPIASIPPG